MKRIRQEIAAPTRQRSLHPGLMSALLSGAMLTAMAGPLLTPATAMAGEAQPAANPSTAVIHTVAYNTPLQSARPPGVVHEAAADPNGGDDDPPVPACFRGMKLEACGGNNASDSSSSAGTGAPKPKQASAESSGGTSGGSGGGSGDVVGGLIGLGNNFLNLVGQGIGLVTKLLHL